MYYRIKELCIKLVIKTSLYYDARSEKHQIKHVKMFLTEGLRLSNLSEFVHSLLIDVYICLIERHSHFHKVYSTECWNGKWMDVHRKLCEGKRPWPDRRYCLGIYVDRLSKTTEIFVHANQVPCHDSNRISLLDPICLVLWLYKCIKVRTCFNFIKGFNGFNYAYVSSRNGDGH
jgi:hypothetical protein